MLKWISAAFAVLLAALGLVKHQRDRANDKADNQERRADALDAVRTTEHNVAQAQQAAREEHPHESDTTTRPTGDFGSHRLRDRP